MTFTKVASLIADQLGVAVETIKMETDFSIDLQADSLDKVEMVMSAEDEFGIQIEDEAALAFKTVGDVVSYIESKVE